MSNRTSNLLTLVFASIFLISTSFFTHGAFAESTITLNNIQSTSGNTSSSNQIMIPGFTPATNSDLLLVGVSANNNNVTSVTFGGVPLARAAYSFYNNDAEFWYLANPSTTGDIVVTFWGPTQAVVGAYSFSGVNQTNPIATTAKVHNLSTGSPHVSITTQNPNDWVLDLPSIWGGVTLGSPTCTQHWDVNVPNAITGASSSALVPSPATVTCKWTASSNDQWDDVAVELEDSTASGTNPSTTNSGSGKTIEFSSNSTFSGIVNASDTLIIDHGVIVTSDGITNYGDVENSGTLKMNNNNDTLDNHGTILNLNGGQISPAIINNYNSANMTIENANYRYYGVTLNNYGSFTTNAGFTMNENAAYGHINNYAGGVIESHGTVMIRVVQMNNSGTFNNYGNMTMTYAGSFYNNGTFNNHSSILLYIDQGDESFINGPSGTFNNFAGSSISIPTRTGGYVKGFYNYGTANNNGAFYNSNLIANHGVFNNNGVIDNVHGYYGTVPADINNYGTFNNNPSGTIDNKGWFNNKCNTSYNNSGGFTGNAVFGACTTNQIIATNPTSGPPGTQVTVSGNNFTPDSTIAVTFDFWQVHASPSTIASNSTGGFVATFSVPPTMLPFSLKFAPNSVQSVSATDGTYSATTIFTILDPPSTPGNLEVTEGNSQTLLTWTAPSNGGSPITNYTIYRGASSGSEALLATAGDVTSYHDYAVTNGQQYFYEVTATNSAGESAKSGEAGATPTADNVVALIATGRYPDAVTVNPATNKIYDINADDETISIINGSTNVATTMPVSYESHKIGVNPHTNKIYVSNSAVGTVSVIDGTTDTVAASISVNLALGAIGVNPSTDMIYVGSQDFASPNNYISAIDGATNTVVAKIPVSGYTVSMGVNPATNKIYVISSGSNNVTVIDGATNTVTASIVVSSSPTAIGVNPNTDRIYATSQGYTTNPYTNSVSVIDGATNTVIATVPVGVYPLGLGVNPTTNKIYVANGGSNNVSVIDGATNTVIDTIPGGSEPLSVGVNPITDMTYVTNRYSNSVSVIDGSKYNVSNSSPPATGIALHNTQTTLGTTSPSNQMVLSNFNAGTASNTTLLLVGISANNNNVTSVTFGGVPLARAAYSFYNNDAEFWYLANPSSTGNIVVNFWGPTQAVVGAYSFSGVNQTSPIATTTKVHNLSTGSPHISITTKYANDWVLDLPSIYGGSALGSPTCIQQWDVNMPDAITGASSSTMAQSPATVTCKWTASSGDLWDDVAVELRAN